MTETHSILFSDEGGCDEIRDITYELINKKQKNNK